MLSLAQHIAICKSPSSEMRTLIAKGGYCVGVARRSWGVGTLGDSALLAYHAVPAGEMHYTDPLDVPEGALCYGLNGQHGQPLTKFGHTWIASVNLQAWTTDYNGMGTWSLAPMSLPRWTKDTRVQWTTWTPYGRLPVGRTQRQRNAAVTFSYRQGKKVYASKMHLGQMNSDSVWNVVVALKAKGFWPAVPTDDYTSSVLLAVKRFQQKQGWTGSGADGIVGPQTCQRLGLVWVK